MAAYPTLPTDELRIATADGSQSSRAQDGTARIRRLYGQKVYTLTLIHRFLTTAEFSALETFYDTNEALTVAYSDTLASNDYTVRMLAPPEQIGTAGLTIHARVVLEGTRD